MNIALLTPSPLGKYDRNTTLLVTQKDGSQQFYPRKTKTGFHQITPLSWWKKCGFVTEERDQWAKSVIHPEHAQIMKHAGIKPSDLFDTVLSPADVEDVLGWLNVYREVYGETPDSLLTFRKFMKSVDSCGDKAKTADPMKVGNYVKTFTNTSINMEAYFFLLHDQEWMDAVKTNLAENRYSLDYREAVITLMRLGATPDAVSVIAANSTSNRYGALTADAVVAFAVAQQFTATLDCYREIRQLAEIFKSMLGQKDFCTKLFLDTDTDRERFHYLVTVEKLTNALSLGAILKEEVPSALVGGFL